MMPMRRADAAPSPSRERITRLAAKLAELERGPPEAASSDAFEAVESRLQALDARLTRTTLTEATRATTLREQLDHAREELASEATARSLLRAKPAWHSAWRRASNVALKPSAMPTSKHTASPEGWTHSTS